MPWRDVTGPHADDDPPEEAYGRVTDAERFRLLHDVALSIIANLETRFDVEVQRGLDDDDGGSGETPSVIDRVSLTPADPRAAPIVFRFTDFPGVRVRFGEWQDVAFPTCGCDACAEDPTDVEADLRLWVDAVTSGHFVEWWNGFDLQHVVTFADGSFQSGRTPALDRAEERRLGTPRTHHWGAWPER